MASRRTVAGDSFEVHFHWNADVLVAQVEGLHDSFDISLAYWKIIAEERLRQGASRVLVLENLCESCPPEVVVDLREHLVSLGFKGCKVAFVDCIDSHRSQQELIALSAREHGILAAVFGDENQALTWLRHSEE